MKPEELSLQLRRGSSRFLRHRRGTVGLSFAAIGSLGVVSLSQVGIIRRVPPLPFLAADAVDAAPEAYEVLDMPDAVLGIASYALTAARASPRRRSYSPRPAPPCASRAPRGAEG